MDENIVYKPPIFDSQNATGKGGLPPEELPRQQVSFHESIPPSPPISISKILKILLGILVILSIGFLIFGFFLPKLFRGLNNDKIEIVYWGLKHEPTAILSIISEF